uniref:Integrase domain containing protein n=1 Tax=Haemonchus contortus TaxID=6289 RepID=A0A7I5E5A4_HAECO
MRWQVTDTSFDSQLCGMFGESMVEIQDADGQDHFRLH